MEFLANATDMQDIEREIQQAIKEADAGDFATDEEVEAVFSKWSSTCKCLYEDNAARILANPGVSV